MKTMGMAKKPKKTQYIIGSIIAILVLFMWISLPLMNKSGNSSSVYGGSFSKKSADLSLLSDGTGLGAPGSPLTGELISNPATSLDMAAASLFSSGESDTATTEQSQGAASTADGDIPAPPSSPGSNYGSIPKGKLSVSPSLTAGNSNSQTVGGNHSKFFGQENIKGDFKPGDLSDVKPKSEKGQALMAALKNAQEQSVKAANASDMNQAKSAASSAFENAAKVASKTDLEGAEEKKFAESGLELGKVDQDFKKSDPNVNKKSIDLPEPTPEEDNDQEQQMKQMLMQMILQATVGQIFGAIGQGIAAGIGGAMGNTPAK